MGESLVRLCEEMGCPISKNRQVAASLLKEQSVPEKQKERGKTQIAKKAKIVSNQ